MRRMCALIQLDNVDYITYNKDKELMQNKNKKEWDNSKNEYDLAKSQVAARKEDVTWKSKAY